MTEEDVIYNFWDQVSVGGDDECWEWKGQMVKGYGRIWTHLGKYLLSHRFSYQIHHNILLTPDILILHKCDNPPCVNPNHLFEGDSILNRADCVFKERQARGANQHRAKLTDDDVLLIRKLHKSNPKKWTAVTLACRFGVTRGCIWPILRKITWRHV